MPFLAVISLGNIALQTQLARYEVTTRFVESPDEWHAIKRSLEVRKKEDASLVTKKMHLAEGIRLRRQP
ncbi:MAG TPA: hypothetical protein VF681_01700 [Abditibacteriaceae bacterium]